MTIEHLIIVIGLVLLCVAFLVSVLAYDPYEDEVDEDSDLYLESSQWLVEQYVIPMVYEYYWPLSKVFGCSVREDLVGLRLRKGTDTVTILPPKVRGKLRYEGLSPSDRDFDARMMEYRAVADEALTTLRAGDEIS